MSDRNGDDLQLGMYIVGVVVVLAIFAYMAIIDPGLAEMNARADARRAIRAAADDCYVSEEIERSAQLLQIITSRGNNKPCYDVWRRDDELVSSCLRRILDSLRCQIAPEEPAVLVIPTED